MTQDDPKMSRALLVIHRRLGLMRRKLTPYKQLGDSVVLPYISTSNTKNTMSMRHILTTYPFTKATSEKAYLSPNAYHSQRNWLQRPTAKGLIS